MNYFYVTLTKPDVTSVTYIINETSLSLYIGQDRWIVKCEFDAEYLKNRFQEKNLHPTIYINSEEKVYEVIKDTLLKEIGFDLEAYQKSNNK